MMSFLSSEVIYTDEDMELILSFKGRLHRIPRSRNVLVARAKAIVRGFELQLAKAKENLKLIEDSGEEEIRVWDVEDEVQVNSTNNPRTRAPVQPNNNGRRTMKPSSSFNVEPLVVVLDDSVIVLDDEEDGTSSSASSEILPTIDPINKQPLKDPVRNKTCNHIYGRTAILELIKKNPHTRCPNMGCTNKAWVKESDLEVDPALAEKIKSKQRAEANSKNRHECNHTLCHTVN